MHCEHTSKNDEQKEDENFPGANPTVKIYSATKGVARFYNKIYFSLT
jgi:hypothetical protein